jgi:hypothetical protein
LKEIAMTLFMRSTFYAGLGAICFSFGSEAQDSPRVLDRPVLDRPPGVTAIADIPQVPVRSWTTGVPYYTTTWTTDTVDSQPIQLARQIAEAKTDSEKEKLKDKLKETLNKQFDDRQKHHEDELAALESKVKKLKDMVAKRQDNKREIIEEKIKQLERETKGLGW